MANEEVAENNDLFLALYKEYVTLALHHQGQASTTANIILILAGAIITLLTFDDKLQGGIDMIGGATLVILGLFGTLWSSKHHERYDHFAGLAEGYRRELAEAVPTLKEVHRTALEESSRQAGLISRTRVRHLWAVLNLLIAGLGIVIIMFSYFD